MVNVGVIGAGHWGPNLIRNLHNGLTSVVGWVVDRDVKRLEEIRSRYPSVRIETDAAALVRDPGVDAVVVATPTSTHFALALEALKQGKHVLVEKPFATSSVEANLLRATAAEHGLVLMVGHVFLYNNAVRWVKERIDAGELGQIYYVATVRTNLGPIRADVNAGWDLASHDISILNYWLDDTPTWVSARTGCWINAGIADVMFATLGYKDEVLANVHVSWLNPRKSREITVAGTRKMLTFDDLNMTEPIRLYDQQVTEARSTPTYVDTFASFRASIRNGDITIPRVSSGEPLLQECDHFIECITTKRQPLTGPDQGTAVVRVLEAIDRSARNGGMSELVRDE